MKQHIIPVPTALLSNLRKRWPGHHWKYIPGYETRYLVSDMGLVYCVATDCLANRMKVVANRTFVIKLVRKGIKYTSPLHNVVAMAFIPNDDPVFKTHVGHRNGDRLDNRVSNLEWLRKSTITERLLEATRKQQAAGGPGIVSYCSSTPDQIRDIRDWDAAGVSHREIAREVGKSLATVRSIIRGDTFAFVE